MPRGCIVGSSAGTGGTLSGHNTTGAHSTPVNDGQSAGYYIRTPWLAHRLHTACSQLILGWFTGKHPETPGGTMSTDRRPRAAKPDPQTNTTTGDQFSPALPDDGRELMMAWEVPTEDWDKLTIKTTQFDPGIQRLRLLRSSLVTEWFLRDVAADFGPGTYKIQAGPGLYRGRNSTITVSQEYARESGWESAPPMPVAPQTPVEIQAQRTFRDATLGAVDPVNLAAMIQVAVDNAIQKAQPRQEINPIDLVLRGFQMANEMTTKSMETARGMLGINQPETMAQPTWADVAMGVVKELPTIMGALGSAMAATRPTPMTPTQPPPQTQQREAIQMKPETPTGPEEQIKQLPPPPPATIPLLKMLKQFWPMLQPHLDGPAEPEVLAQELSGLAGPNLDPAVHATAEHLKQYGSSILGHAVPQLMTSDKAASVIIHWSDLLAAEEQDAKEDM